ncbi:MAG: hypothetical protein K6A32_06470 [Bacteroidales bacterium]|nr:hypothetical protein [Bacteroidales bacterium]
MVRAKASSIRSLSLTRQVAQPQTTGRSASCDWSFSVMRLVVQRHATGRSTSHVRSHSLKRRVAQRHTYRRSASCVWTCLHRLMLLEKAESPPEESTLFDKRGAYSLKNESEMTVYRHFGYVIEGI